MGIFERLKRIVKANVHAGTRSFEEILNDSDEELKRLIDELTRAQTAESSKEDNGRSQENHRTTDRPPRRPSARSSESGSDTSSTRGRAGQSQSAPPPDPRHQAQVQAVYRAYKVFGLDPSVSVDDIKKAYRSAMRRVHPDRVANASAEEQDIAKRKAQELNAAYDLLAKIRGFS